MKSVTFHPNLELFSYRVRLGRATSGSRGTRRQDLRD
jgi:hypothetical protein